MPFLSANFTSSLKKYIYLEMETLNPNDWKANSTQQKYSNMDQLVQGSKSSFILFSKYLTISHWPGTYQTIRSTKKGKAVPTLKFRNLTQRTKTEF